MENSQNNNSLKNSLSLSLTLRVLLAIALVGLALAFLRLSADMINALLLSWIIVLVASPLLHWLLSKRVPKGLSFALTLIAILAVFIAFALLLVVAVNRLAEAIPSYAAAYEDLMASIQTSLASLGIDTGDIQAFIEFLDPVKLVDFAANFLSGLIGTVSGVLLVALLIIFLMLDAINAPAKLAREIKSGNKYLQRFFTTSRALREYVLMTTVVGLVTGVVDTIWFLILGVDFAVLWGILAFLMSYIPSLGFWLAAIPPTILALLESGPAVAALVFLGIVVINGFAENVVKPKYMGTGLNLSPFMIVFSVIFWAGILGPLGAILGVPMTVMFKELVLEADEQNRWIARLISSSDKETPGDQAANEDDLRKEVS
jgi:predicted PurR-regulated permease PerM